MIDDRFGKFNLQLSKDYTRTIKFTRFETKYRESFTEDFSTWVQMKPWPYPALEGYPAS